MASLVCSPLENTGMKTLKMRVEICNRILS
jgi:hypothetical protein